MPDGYMPEMPEIIAFKGSTGKSIPEKPAGKTTFGSSKNAGSSKSAGNGKNDDDGKISSEGKKNGEGKKKPKKLKTFKKAVVILFQAFLIVFLLLGGGALALVYHYLKDVPVFDPGMLQPAVTSYIYDNSDREIANLYYDQNRIEIPLESIPLHVQRAFVAIEDERFYEHYGVDPWAILRAFVINFQNKGSIEQGGSTISQQVIKTAFLTPEKTYQRKAQEAWLAFQMERRYSKDEILEIYINQIPFAHGAYGIESAANTYFNKSAKDLTLSEATLLAGIPRSPNYYSPFNNFDAAKQRQILVLQKMYDLGYITHREMTDARNAELVFGEIPSRQYDFPYFVDYVLHRELINILLSMPDYDTREEAYEAIYNMGLKVYTTLDVDKQNATQKVLSDSKLYPQNLHVDMNLLKEMMRSRRLDSYPSEVILSEGGVMQPQGAAVVANPVTGEIYALVGGREYSKDNQDLRYLSPRQPGSAIKPILDYAPAMEEGLLTPGAIIDDAPYIRGSWAPENWDRRFRGLVTVREAIIPSLNIPAVKAFEQVTPEIGLDYLKKMGITTIHADDYNLASSIGGMTHGVTALDMAQAYAVLANQGIKVNLHAVKKIEDRNGKIIYEFRSNPQTVLSPPTAFLLTDMLRDVVRRGTAGRLNVGRPVAAKTGTTDGDRDAYLVTYTPNIVISLWLGHDIPTLGRIGGGSGTNVTFMNSIMGNIMKDIPALDFVRPDGVTGLSICNKSGQRPGEFCPPGTIISELFPTNNIPQGSCNMHQIVPVCTVTGLIPDTFCEQEMKHLLLRPEYVVTDGRWRGAGRAPEDAGQQAPREICPGHYAQPNQGGVGMGPGSGSPHGFMSYLLDNPLRVQLWWNQQDDAREFLLYRRLQNREVVLLDRFPGTINQYTDDQIKRGEVYIYLLVAVDSAGNRSRAAEQVVSTPSAASNQPPPDVIEEQDPGLDSRYDYYEDEETYYDPPYEEEYNYGYGSEPIFNYD